MSAAVNRMRDAFIHTAEDDARTNGPGTLNDLLGALVDAQAFYLAAIPDEALRQSMIASAARALPQQVEQYVKSAIKRPTVQTVVLPERTN